MLETLQTSTMVTGYGLLATPTTTTVSGIKKVKDEEGNTVALDASVFKTTLGTSVSAATTATGVGQDLSYQKTISEVRSAQSYVESMSDEELANLEAMLAEKELEFTEDSQVSLDEVKSDTKVYVRK